MTKQNEKDAKRVPELRFKGFADAWEQRKLGEIADFNPKEDLPLTFEYVDLESVSGTTMIAHRTEQKSSAPSRAQRLARLGDLFYQNVRPYQKNNYLLDKNDHTYVFSTGYTQMRPIINGYFLLTLVQRQNFVDKVLKRCTGTSYPAINSKNLSRIKVLIPSTSVNFHSGILDKADMNRSDTNEAEKIGQLFQSLDKTITLHEEQHRQLERLKKALLQKMFADETGYPTLRFKGFTEKWEQSYLKDIASVNSGRDYKHLNKGNIPVYGTGGYMLSVDKALSNTKDGIGIGRKGTINNPYILKAPFWTVDTLFYVIPYNVDLNFLYGIFQKIDWRKKDESTGVPSLSKENINKTKFKIPAISEQKEIGTIFQNLDTLIALHQHKIDNLKHLKRALLQKMFV